MFLRIMRNYINNGKKPIDEKLKINKKLNAKTRVIKRYMK